MTKLLSKAICLCMGVVLLSFNTDATETNKSQVYKEVEQAKANGLSFEKVSLFNIAEGEKHDVLSSEVTLTANTTAIKSLFDKKSDAISLEFTTADGKTYQLDAMRSTPFSMNPNIGFIDASGKHPFTHDIGLHYQGAVAGSEKSLAAISIFASGEVMILFANEDGNFVVGKLENSDKYILYNDEDFLSKPEMPCGTVDEKEIDIQPSTGDKTTASYECNKVRLYWEADYDLYVNKTKSVTRTQDYLAGMFNQVQTMYRNERIAIELTSIYIWITPDAYRDGGSHEALIDFRNKMNGQGQFDGDLAMLIARDPGGNGGVAYLGGLCKGIPYAYGDVNGSYSAVPSYSWDVSMVTHEIGHNIGSPHTHWCGWNTGAGGSCGAIDNCTTLENGSGCNTCPVTFNNSAPTSSWQGTVMSYCHLKNRGVSLANGFGPLPGDLIRNAVSSLSCLKSIISVTLNGSTICRDYGKIDVIFDSTVIIGNSNFGTANYKYQWSAGNVTSKDISIVKPGTYSVKITDSNNCTETFSTTVTQSTDAACASTSIHDIERHYVSLYPNPAHENVSLKFFSNSAEHISIRLMDITGKTVKTEAITTVTGENNITLNLNGITSGMYYISFMANSTDYVNLKLVVE